MKEMKDVYFAYGSSVPQQGSSANLWRVEKDGKLHYVTTSIVIKKPRKSKKISGLYRVDTKKGIYLLQTEPMKPQLGYPQKEIKFAVANELPIKGSPAILKVLYSGKLETVATSTVIHHPLKHTSIDLWLIQTAENVYILKNIL